MKKAQEQKATQPLEKPKNPKQPTLLDLVGLFEGEEKEEDWDEIIASRKQQR